ncbi:MAG: peptide deformylase [Sneathiellales bacterium]|nr:peptide deformylase [Sneathiellales bacterium]
MPKLSLVIAPDPIFRKKAETIEQVDDEIREMISQMFEILYREKGAGIGANMVGLLKRIIVMDLKEGGKASPLAMINPEILARSEEMQVFEEASLSYPGISAEVIRSKEVTVAYLDEEGEPRKLTASGFLATVIQHEMDYLEGKTYLDHLSRVKRDNLLRRYKKNKRQRVG